MIGEDTILLFRHLHIKTAESGLNMGYGNMKL